MIREMKKVRGCVLSKPRREAFDAKKWTPLKFLRQVKCRARKPWFKFLVSEITMKKL